MLTKKLVDETRHAVWVATSTLTSKLISSQESHEEIIISNLQKAERYLAELSNLTSIEAADITEAITDVQIDLENIKYYILQLIESGKDRN